MTIKSKIEVRERSINRDSDYHKHTRVYFFHDDESMMDNFGNRVARPTNVYQEFLPDVAKALGLPPNTKFRWNQYAGCSCPCSPGFICRESKAKDVYVHLSGAPTTNAKLRDELQALDRKVQLTRQLTLEAEVAKKH